MPKEWEPNTPQEPEPKPEPSVPDPPAPDLDSLLAEEREKQAARERELELTSARYEERLKQLEGILQQGFSRKTPPPTDDRPPVTEEDFLTPAEAKAAAERIAEEKALAVGRALDENYRTQMAATQEALFEQRYEKHSKGKYFKYIQKDLDEAIEKNPNLKLAPKALDVLVKSLVGSKMDDIVAAEREAPLSNSEAGDGPAPPPRPSISGPRRRVAPPTAPTLEHDNQEVVLDEDAEDVRAKFAPYIRRMSKGKRDLSPERFAQSLSERSRTKRVIPDLEDKNAR